MKECEVIEIETKLERNYKKSKINEEVTKTYLINVLCKDLKPKSKDKWT